MCLWRHVKFISDKTIYRIHQGLEKLSENKINGYSI